ncbi:hypothetical protein C6A85_08335, partial [Mycobacterium sp. ITM-2017-0098]
PLAWDGVFAFYIPGLVLVVWLFATTAVMLKSIKAEQQAQASGPSLKTTTTQPGSESVATQRLR